MGELRPGRSVGAKKLASALIALLVLPSLILWAGCDPYLVKGEPVPGKACLWYFPSSADGLMIPCTVYLPKGYDPGKAYPLWVELHALYSIPLIDNNLTNSTSNALKKLADEKGWILIGPWGRNRHTLYVDGMVKSKPPYNEPDILDDFSQGAASWQAVSGSWEASGGTYRQKDTSLAWKESVRLASTGKDYGVRFKVRDLTPTRIPSGIGVNLRRDVAHGDGYRAELMRETANRVSIRVLKQAGGASEEMVLKKINWTPPSQGDGWIEVAFSCYDDYLELALNGNVVILHAKESDYLVYGFGRDVPGEPLEAGEISLCSYGGMQEFDEVRVQNEYEYGERDALDCVYGAMEKYKVDPARVYLMGMSMGGLGSYVLGLHHPDLFTAVRPSSGATDIGDDYAFLRTYYPENPPAPYAPINDLRISEFIRLVAGGEPDAAYPDRMSVLNQNSARYILENAVNNYWDLNHGAMDCYVPNTHGPVNILWMVPFWSVWALTTAPAPYSPAVPVYAHGEDIYDVLQAWSSRGGYSCRYVSDPGGGHGWMEPFADTVGYFQDKVSDRRPAEVAVKTYDDINVGAWWLRLRIPRPGTNQPGMARVRVDAAANTAAVHARNLSRLSLDLEWMDLDGGAGKTLTFLVDDNTAPNLFPISDTTGSLALELQGEWADPSGLAVALDGTPLPPGAGYRVDGTSLVVDNLPTRGGHTLVVRSPSSLPQNLAPNPGVEVEGSGGNPSGWTGEVQGGGSASFQWEGLEAHGGARSLRIKDAVLSTPDSRPVWRSGTIDVTPGEEYLLSAFAKARMLRGGSPVLGVAWYDGARNLLGVNWIGSPGGEGFALNRDWSSLCLQATAPAGCAYASVLAGIGGAFPGQNAGSAWFDDFSFTAL